MSGSHEYTERPDICGRFREKSVPVSAMSAMSIAISCPACVGIRIRPVLCPTACIRPSYSACTLTYSYGRPCFFCLSSAERFGAGAESAVLSSIR